MNVTELSVADVINHRSMSDDQSCKRAVIVLVNETSKQGAVAQRIHVHRNSQPVEVIQQSSGPNGHV
jgi:hypothetical protein